MSPGLRRVRVGVLVLALLGIAVSAYLVYEHLSASTSFACPENATVNCVKVTTSSYSRFLGIPVSVLGLGYFVAMAVLALPPLWDRGRILDRVRLAAALGGVVFVLYLVWAELFRIDAICLWCTAVHVISLALFALLAAHQALQSPTASPAR